ncbi:hypothetical protein [Streptomyces sp. NPDC000618]|uniref:hypothetical protein n=1 Tax=Streptomyces sp. NPDC000618 TaxID=3154265 RepID=UPI00332735FF
MAEVDADALGGEQPDGGLDEQGAVAGAVGGGQDERRLVRAVLETAAEQHHAVVFGHRPIRCAHDPVGVPDQREGMGDLRCGQPVRGLGLGTGVVTDRVHGLPVAGQHTARDRSGGSGRIVGDGDPVRLAHHAEVVWLEALGLQRGDQVLAGVVGPFDDTELCAVGPFEERDGGVGEVQDG